MSEGTSKDLERAAIAGCAKSICRCAMDHKVGVLTMPAACKEPASRTVTAFLSVDDAGVERLARASDPHAFEEREITGNWEIDNGNRTIEKIYRRDAVETTRALLAELSLMAGETT